MSIRNLRRLQATHCAGALLGIALVMLACGAEPDSVPEDAMTESDINAVMEAHVQELMALPGVTGVAIGATDEGAPCILVLILEEKESITAGIPAEIEGYPVRTYVSGEIHPMGDDSSGSS